MIARAEWIMEVRTWIGTPWVHQGRNRLGVDCVGLLICPARDLGLTTFESEPYGRSPPVEYLMRMCDAHLTKVKVAVPGDILLMKLGRMPQHFAILVGPNRIVQARGDTGSVVETNLPGTWKRRVVATYSMPGVV